MLKTSLKWYFPSSSQEAVKIVSEHKGTVFHAGGTGILRVRSSSTYGLVDLSGTGCSYIRQEHDRIIIGGTTPFSDIMAYNAEDHTPFRLLQHAVASAASTPLRHRITLGGSVADCPPWSDVLAPLIVGGAHVHLLSPGGLETSLSMAEYFEKRKTLKESLITEVALHRGTWSSVFFKRYTRVTFEYAAFTLAGLADLGEDAGRFKDIRLAGTGSRDILIPLGEQARLLKGQSLNENLLQRAADTISAKFPDAPEMTGQFRLKLFRTFFKDGVRRMAGLPGGEDN